MGPVNLAFKDKQLDRLETDAGFDGGYSPSIVRAFRTRVQYIREARDERDFYSYKAWRYEKLKGDRAGQHSMRLNDQWRIILEIEEQGSEKLVVVVGIEDYH